jgi:hypothetical protein
MRAHLVPIAILGAIGGCGPHETEFIPQYAASYCSYYVSCADPAVMAFDGVDTQEECLARYGPDIEAEGEGCKLARSEAKKCLRAMEALACPSDPAELDASLPPVCDYAWKKCLAQPGEADTDDPTL